MQSPWTNHSFLSKAYGHQPDRKLSVGWQCHLPMPPTLPQAPEQYMRREDKEALRYTVTRDTSAGTLGESWLSVGTGNSLPPMEEPGNSSCEGSEKKVQLTWSHTELPQPTK